MSFREQHRIGVTFRRALVSGSFGALMLSFSGVAAAQTPLAPPVAPEPAPSRVGGHIGIATPLVTISDETTTIGDQFTLLNPIGIGLKVAPRLAIDFEMVVATPVSPDGVTGLVIDPGVIYDAGPVALGLRVAFQINALSNVGLIPLVNRGLVDLGGATWFVEAAFPTFYQNETVAFNIVAHTGIGF